MPCDVSCVMHMASDPMPMRNGGMESDECRTVTRAMNLNIWLHDMARPRNRLPFIVRPSL